LHFVRALRADRRAPASGVQAYVLEREQRVDAPLSEVAAFFEEPKNLGALTPPWLNFEITEVLGMPMHAGTEISCTIKQYGVPMSWQTEIVEYEPGGRFVDLQVSGPYRYWRHEHTFERDGDSTIMRDRIEYQMPFGVLGRLVHRFLVSRQIEAIFLFRMQAVQVQFGDELRLVKSGT